MAKKKTNSNSSAKKTKNGIPILVVPKNATLRQIYAIAKKEFTAADLAKYAQDEPMVPAEQLLAELEVIHREASAERKKNKRKKK